MSSGLVPPSSPPPETPVVVPPPTEYEHFIDQRLTRTRRQVKRVDVANALVTLAVGVLGYLFVAAMDDHWLVVGGLGFWGRLLLWTGLVAGAATYCVRQLLPPLLHRINPVFAAETIEKSEHKLRNSLINFLLLRGRRQEVAAPVYQAMEYQAAADLSKVQIETAIDRGHLIHMGCMLAAIVALFSIYLVFSPKNPLRSVARVLWPWSAIEAPTRVTIRDVQPGDATAFLGDSVTISADIVGLKKGEPALVVYSTADGQVVDQTVPMTPPEEGYRYQGRLPPGSLGLQQDYEYHLSAADCQSRRYHITAQIAPAIDVDSVSYRYPAYTGIADQTVQRQGDLRAIEGTEVTLHATANTQIKPDTAEIDLGCTGRRGVRMTAEGRTAVGRFTLRLNPDDASRGQYESYQLRFSDLAGRENLRPIRYRIEVIPDLPPDVRIVEPQAQETQVAENGRLPIKLRAEDPDFALRSVAVRAECDGRRLPLPPLLERRSDEKPWQGEFQGTYTFEPAKLGLHAGDHVQYWGEAEDNIEPEAHRSVTGKQWITVVGPEGRPQTRKSDGAKGGQPQPDKDNKAAANGRAESPDKPADDNRPSDEAKPDQPDQNPAGKPEKEQKPGETAPPKEGEPRKQKQDSGQQQGGEQQGNQPNQDGGQQGDGKQGGKQNGGGKEPGNQPSSGDQQQGGQPSGKPNGKIDPDAAPGDAMNEIIKDLNKNQQKQPPDKSKPGDKGGEKQDGAGEKQPGNQPPAEKPPKDGEKPTGDNAANQTPQGEKGSQPQPDGKKPGGEKSGGAKPEDNKKPGGETGGKGNAGQQETGSEQPTGNKGPSQKGAGGKPNGQKSPEEQPSGENQPSTEPGEAANGKKSAGKNEPGGKTEPGNAAGGQEEPSQATPGQEKPKEKPGANPAGGQPAGSKAGGSKQQPPAGQQPPDKNATGEPQPGEEQTPRPDKKAGDNSGSPAPQGDNKPREEKPGKAGPAPGEQKKEDAQSPSISGKRSTGQSETAGDRSGNGQQGGGQQGNQSGTGGPGKHTPADQGGSKANDQGSGETGNKAGNQTPSNKPTGSGKKQEGKGAGPGEETPNGGPPDGKASPGAGPGGGENKAGDQKADQAQKPGESNSPAPGGTPPKNPPKGGSPGNGTSEGPKGPAAGSPGGGQSGAKPPSAKPPQPVETPVDQPNLDYARRQTELAIEHLRDQLAKEKPELLDRLGWTKDDAQRFIDRWEAMKRAAAQEGPKGAAARRQLNDALRSLGLRPRGAELRCGGTAQDQPENLRDAGRFAPPPEWAEQFRAYTRGVAGGQRKKANE